VLRPAALDERARCGRPPSGPLASGLVASPALASRKVPWPGAYLDRFRRPVVPSDESFPKSGLVEEDSVEPLPDAPSRVQLRSLASSIVRRACPRECAPSPPGQTRPPQWWPFSLREDLLSPAQSFPSSAWCLRSPCRMKTGHPRGLTQASKVCLRNELSSGNQDSTTSFAPTPARRRAGDLYPIRSRSR
jgi:hypothetical protein